jgi:NADH-quinone oxidoreductase subunit M
MPGTPGFDGIHLLIDGTIQGQGWLIAIAILFGNVLTVGLLLRAFQQIFIASPKRFQGPYVNMHQASSPPSPRNEWIITIAICGLLLTTGINSSPWLLIIDQNIQSTGSNSHNDTSELRTDKLLTPQYITSKDN